MTMFGWRPKSSCYVKSDTANTPGTATCPSPTWFWIGLAAAVVFGVSKKKA